MDERNISSRIYACLDPFSTNSDSETEDTLNGGGRGPARLDGGEGPQLRTGRMKLRAVLFGGVFTTLFVAQVCSGVHPLASVVGASIYVWFTLFDLILDAGMHICDCVFRALENAATKVLAWRSRNRRSVFMLCLSSLIALEASSPLFGGRPVWEVGLPLIVLVSCFTAYDIHTLDLLKAAFRAMSSAFGALRRKGCIHVAASEDETLPDSSSQTDAVG